jgi:O-antigen ligase
MTYGDTSAQFSSLRQFGYVIIFVMALSGMKPIQNWRKIWRMPLLLSIALAWCWLSVIWSIAPAVTLRRALLTTLVIWSAFLCVDQMGYRRSLQAIRVVLCLTLVANYLAVFLTPGFGIHTVEDMADPGLIGDWRGIMMQKNAAGPMCVFLIFTFLFDAKSIHWILRVGAICLSAFFLVKTGSKTSMQVLLVSLVAGVLYVRFNPSYRALLIPLLMVSGVAFTLFSELYWEEITRPFDSRNGFTGRVLIWRPLTEYAQDHLLLGCGFGAFWGLGSQISPIFHYATGWVTKIAHGHDGYLDLLITIGAPGLILVVTSSLIVPVARLLIAKSIPRPAGALMIAIIIFCAGHNLTESNLFDRDQPVQLYLMISMAMVYLITKNSKSRYSEAAGSHKRAT